MLRRHIVLAILLAGAAYALGQTRPAPRLTESWYRDRLAECLGGTSEYRLPDGTRVDVLTADVAFEVDWPPNLWQAVGQALWYAKRTGRRPAIYLIAREKTDSTWIDRARIICREQGILLFVHDARVNRSDPP